MVGALWTGISGLAGQQTALDNESHNIANVNTVGYKASRISFADQLYQNQIGKGTKILDAEKLYTQGNLKLTGVSYDVALSGDGFFSVSDTSGGGTSETYYTRAGNFRMGDNGTLQDASGNEVQGWALSSEQNVETTNANASYFTNDYTKLLSSKIVQYSSSVETITAKATDYSLTAKADDTTIFSGSGLKTKSGKIADVEELIKSYTSALQSLKNDPNVASATSTNQISHIDLPDQSNTADSVSADGDQVYVFVNGDKISQSYISGTANGTLSAAEDGYIKTMKAFADQISKAPGIKAYVSETLEPYNPSTMDADVLNGTIRIESIIPGEAFTITSTGMVHSSNDKPGTVGTETLAIMGTGVGALNSARLALSEAVTGKQTDVFTPSDLDQTGVNDVSLHSYTLDMLIYDKGLEDNIALGQIVFTNPADIDAMVATINADINYQDYVKAQNINGNLVIKTLDSNFDVEYTSDMKVTTPAVSEIQTVALAGTATADISFLGSIIAGTSGQTAAAAATTITGATKAATILAWNTANPDQEITDITSAAGILTITYGNSVGNTEDLLASSSNGISFGTGMETTVGITPGDIRRNLDYSGREGTGAEFIELTTTIDQSASKGSLQLRLDSLGISDSAFGDFSVDSSGLITMSQDGAQFAVGQIAIAKFITNRGLEPIGDNLLRSTLASGDPIFNLNNDKTAEIQSNTLELSTADLSESLVNLMVFQRAFEANAKSITTADTILNTLIALKR
jgi:flagellar hook protein FlgE